MNNTKLRNMNLLNTNRSILLAVLATLIFASAAVSQTRRRAPIRRATNKAAPRRVAQTPSAPVCPPSASVTTESGLTYVITRPGEGRQPVAGDTVLVHYTGLLTDGTKFDSSRDRGNPIAFPLGAGRVIKGWDEGVARLRVGDRATLIIPPQLGYGARGAGDGLIPPDSTLIFVIEVVDVKGATPAAVTPPGGE